MQTAGFIQAQRLGIAAQFDKDAAEGPGGGSLLGHPQHIFGARDNSLEQPAAGDAGECGNARKIGMASLGYGLRIGKPEQWRTSVMRHGAAHQRQRKPAKAGCMSCFSGAQFAQGRPCQSATQRGVKSLHPGADKPGLRCLYHWCTPNAQQRDASSG